MGIKVIAATYEHFAKVVLVFFIPQVPLTKVKLLYKCIPGLYSKYIEFSQNSSFLYFVNILSFSYF